MAAHVVALHNKHSPPSHRHCVNIAAILILVAEPTIVRFEIATTLSRPQNQLGNCNCNSKCNLDWQAGAQRVLLPASCHVRWKIPGQAYVMYRPESLDVGYISLLAIVRAAAATWTPMAYTLKLLKKTLPGARALHATGAADHWHSGWHCH